MFPTVEKFMEYTPEQMYYFLTCHMARTLASGKSLDMVDRILSCLDPDARRALCVGTACARAMGIDPAYRDALKASMGTVLYAEMKGGKAHA